MYKPIEGTLRMTENEAAEQYPDNFILFCADDMHSEMGTVLYAGDNQSELVSLLFSLKDKPYCGVLEGLNLRRSLGGVVVCG